MWKPMVIGAGVAVAIAALCLQERALAQTSSADEVVAQLRRLVPNGPRAVSKADLPVLRAAAETRRLDAARLLVRALALNLDPNEATETTAADVMLPAIPLLREYFAADIGPILFAEGVGSAETWYQARVAAAARLVLPADTLKSLMTVFALEGSPTAGAARFRALLLDPRARLEYAPAVQPEVKGLEEALKRKAPK
jgi:hypothetical protein